MGLDADAVDGRLVGADLAARGGGLGDDLPVGQVDDELAAAVAGEPELGAHAPQRLVAARHDLQRHGVLDHAGRHAEGPVGRRGEAVRRAAEHRGPGGERHTGDQYGNDPAHGCDNPAGAQRSRIFGGAKPSCEPPVLSPMPRISLLALMALLALPVSANAAEGFVGVTERGSVVRFTSETPLSLTKPKRPTGMAPGERIVALGQGQRGVVAVGSSAQLYALDPVTVRATAIGPSFPQGLRGSRFSLPRRRTATRRGCSPTSGRTSSSTSRPARAPTVRACGARATAPRSGPPPTSRSRARCSASSSTPPSTCASSRAARRRWRRPRWRRRPSSGSASRAAFSLGSNGRGYVVAVLTDRRRDRQSALLTIDTRDRALRGRRARSASRASRGG